MYRNFWINSGSYSPQPSRKYLLIATCPLTFNFRSTAQQRVDHFKLMLSTHALHTRYKLTVPAYTTCWFLSAFLSNAVVSKSAV